MFLAYQGPTSPWWHPISTLSTMYVRVVQSERQGWPWIYRLSQEATLLLCARIIFIIFLINFCYLIFYLIRSRAHNGISTSHDRYYSDAMSPLSFNPLIFSRHLHPHSYFLLFSTIQNHPEHPHTRKAMPTTSSMIPPLHHSLLILLFHPCSHDLIPHGHAPYLLSPHGPFSQTPIPHYNWKIDLFLILYEPFTYST
jgi:hypothetical protein